MKTWMGVAAAIALSGCCSARAQSNDEQTEVRADESVLERVRALLSGYEHVPTADEWRNVGKPEEVAAALMALATEPGAKTVTAARATSSLGHFPRPEVSAFLTGRMADTRLPATLRGKAAIAAGLAFGDDRADEIAALLSSDDPGLREDAVRAFNHLVSPAAERFIEARLAHEPEAHIRDAMTATKTRIAEGRRAAEGRGALPDKVKNRPAVRDPGPIRAR